MTALTFGSSRAPLVGFHHAAQGTGRPRKAALLCNPFGEEAIRAFRPMKRLADMLAAEGIGVLRFDYYGTGDSAGDDDEVSVARMADDILTADDELRELTRARKIYWVGLRLGGWACLEAAVRTPPSGLMLWEPVLSGETYLTELGSGDPSPMESNGFPIPESLRAELAGDPPAVHGPTKAVGPAALAGAEILTAPDTDDWNSDAALNSYAMPIATIELICREIAAW